MAETYDIVVAGAGHNGMIAGAYLAKAGLKVCVVEKRDHVGGAIGTYELSVKGFKNDPGATIHSFIQGSPLMRNDELKLQSKYGLKYLHARVPVSVIYPDDSYMVFYNEPEKTAKTIEAFSKHDADAYMEFYRWSAPLLDMFLMGTYNPPPTLGGLFSMLESQGEIGKELMRMTLMNADDLSKQWFEDDRTRMAMSRWAAEAMQSPLMEGTGISVMLMLCMTHKVGQPFPEGGSVQLPLALEKCLKDHGATIRTSCPIKRIKVEGGKATGVVLESGEEILAKKAVISNLNIRQLFPGMVSDNVPTEYLKAVKNLKPSSYGAFNQLLALNESPKYKAGPIPSEALSVEMSPWYDEYIEEFMKFGRNIPCSGTPVMSTYAANDPTRAPKGKDTAYLYHFAPSYPFGHPWTDSLKKEIADGIVRTMRRFATNMTDDNILGRSIWCPKDYEEWDNAMVGGDLMHIGAPIYQMFGNRPVIGYGCKTPVEKLYLAAACCHPGGGVIGGGRASVQVVMQDLGIDFEKTITA